MQRVSDDTVLANMVSLALPQLRQAQGEMPRTQRGAKPRFAEWLVAAFIMFALLHRKKTKTAQYRFLTSQRARLRQLLGQAAFPSRATYFRRYRRSHRLYQAAIGLQGQAALAEGVTDAENVAMDKSLIAALGVPWHQRDRHAGKQPAGVDSEAAWGYSEHDGWVYGFSYEVVVSATANATVFPLLASVEVASAAETTTAREKIAHLPAQTRTVAADAAYDANHLGEAVEYTADGQRTGRRFLCPQNPRNNGRSKTKPGHADAARARSRQRRAARQAYLQGRQGHRLYARRKLTVEPFNQWLKGAFELEQRVWHRGLDNNRTQLLAAIFAYQVIVRYNHRCGSPKGRIRPLLDAL